METSKFLLPYKLRPVGIALVAIGIVLLVLKYHFNYKPDYLNIKVFAIYAFYLEAKTFSLLSHQMLPDIAGIFMLAGLFLIAFTKEKSNIVGIDSLRLKAFFVAAYANLIYLLISILFFFGFGFVGALTVFIYVWLLAYLITFRILLFRNRQAGTSI